MQKTNPSEKVSIKIEVTDDKAILLLQKQVKHLTRTLDTVVASAKQKLLEAGKLQKVDCYGCKYGPTFVTTAQKVELAEMNRSDISYSVFHCEKKACTAVFHSALETSDFRWSCCDKDLFKKED